MHKNAARTQATHTLHTRFPYSHTLTPIDVLIHIHERTLSTIAEYATWVFKCLGVGAGGEGAIGWSAGGEGLEVSSCVGWVG